MDEPARRKKAMRAAMKSRLAEVSPEELHRLSAQACDRLMKSDFFAGARTVMLYLPIPGELDISPVALRCFQTGRTVCAPRVNWEHHRLMPMEIHCLDTGVEVRRHGLREPVEGAPVPLEEIDLVIVPGLAFDVSGNRLGRGGGHYDRFLARPELRSLAVRCGVCFDFQIVDEAPTLDTDVRLGAVVTDRRSILTPCQNTA
ncbi:MAG: 5-formyltetrahydrofolate cyclo-ligase [Planctomycetota bacterium]|nr:5-formyltetrahydrofolate cyclo-ligase [Planctomycetota bacterium]